MQGKLSVARGCNEGYGGVDLLPTLRPLLFFDINGG